MAPALIILAILDGLVLASIYGPPVLDVRSWWSLGSYFVFFLGMFLFFPSVVASLVVMSRSFRELLWATTWSRVSYGVVSCYWIVVCLIVGGIFSGGI